MKPQPRDRIPTAAMRLRLPPQLVFLILAAACRPTPAAAPDPARLDAVARRYVVLGSRPRPPRPQLRRCLLRPRFAACGGQGGVADRGAGPVVGRVARSPCWATASRPTRTRWSACAIATSAFSSASMAARARMLDGERLRFDQEARGAVRCRRRRTLRRALRFAARAARQSAARAGHPWRERYQHLPRPPHDSGEQGRHGLQDRHRRVPGTHAGPHRRCRRASASISST